MLAAIRDGRGARPWWMVRHVPPVPSGLISKVTIVSTCGGSDSAHAVADRDAGFGDDQLGVRKVPRRQPLLAKGRDADGTPYLVRCRLQGDLEQEVTGTLGFGLWRAHWSMSFSSVRRASIRSGQ